MKPQCVPLGILAPALGIAEETKLAPLERGLSLLNSDKPRPSKNRQFSVEGRPQSAYAQGVWKWPAADITRVKRRATKSTRLTATRCIHIQWQGERANNRPVKDFSLAIGVNSHRISGDKPWPLF
jgi:hypothetical protein